MLNPEGMRELQQQMERVAKAYEVDLNALPRPVARQDVQRVARQHHVEVTVAQADGLVDRLNGAT